MDITIQPRKLSGSVNVIPSKSMAHRYLICAAFADNETDLICPETSRDMNATAHCLNALGAEISRTDVGYHIIPIRNIPRTAILKCHESGSTLRFLLPIVGAMGIDAVFQMEGRLPERPLSPLWEEMERMGCTLTRPTADAIRCTGKLRAGEYVIEGNVSSQFITGLLFATSLIEGECNLRVCGKIESKPYITMTKEAMKRFGAPRYHSPGQIIIEGDWSNGAFWLAAQALGSRLEIHNLDANSNQGDRVAADLIPALQENLTIDTSDIPDLVPILSIVAAANRGAVFTNIQRLRLKESDRVESVIQMIHSLGGIACSTEDTLTILGTGLEGGTVHSHHDHRITMSAAIAATVCVKPVTIVGAEAVTKSYPKFWEEYRHLGGNYEQHLR